MERNCNERSHVQERYSNAILCATAQELVSKSSEYGWRLRCEWMSPRVRKGLERMKRINQSNIDHFFATEVIFTCLNHTLTTEAEEIMGLLLGDIEVRACERQHRSIHHVTLQPCGRGSLCSTPPSPCTLCRLSSLDQGKR